MATAAFIENDKRQKLNLVDEASALVKIRTFSSTRLGREASAKEVADTHLIRGSRTGRSQSSHEPGPPVAAAFPKAQTKVPRRQVPDLRNCGSRIRVETRECAGRMPALGLGSTPFLGAELSALVVQLHAREKLVSWVETAGDENHARGEPRRGVKIARRCERGGLGPAARRGVVQLRARESFSSGGATANDDDQARGK